MTFYGGTVCLITDAIHPAPIPYPMGGLHTLRDGESITWRNSSEDFELDWDYIQIIAYTLIGNFNVARASGYNWRYESTYSLLQTGARALNKETYGAAMGFLATTMDVGQMLGLIVTGFILATFGYSGSFWSLGGILLGFCIIFSIYHKLTSDQQ